MSGWGLTTSIRLITTKKFSVALEIGEIAQTLHILGYVVSLLQRYIESALQTHIGDSPCSDHSNDVSG